MMDSINGISDLPLQEGLLHKQMIQYQDVYFKIKASYNSKQIRQ